MKNKTIKATEKSKNNKISEIKKQSKTKKKEIKDKEIKKKKRIYKEANKCETETTVNVLYGEKILSVYTNKVSLQKQLFKILGEPNREYIKGRSITGSTWDIPLKEKAKITKLMLKANIFEL